MIIEELIKKMINANSPESIIEYVLITAYNLSSGEAKALINKYKNKGINNFEINDDTIKDISSALIGGVSGYAANNIFNDKPSIMGNIASALGGAGTLYGLRKLFN